MVKFSKELEAQLIPEWKDAFVNYWQLKKQIKKIKVSRVPKQAPDADFGVSIFDPIRFVTKKISDKLFNFDNKLTEIIQVKSKIIENGEEEEIYETELAQLFSEEDEVRVFFEGLDEELNKVNQFYKTKETEFLDRGEILNKQLQILLDLKQILNDRRWKNSLSKPKLPSVPSSWSSTPRNSDYSSESSAELSATPTSTELTQTDEAIAALERNGVSFTNTATRGKTKKGKPKMAMRIDIPNNTPTRTITAVTSMLWEDLVNNPKKEVSGEFINKKKIQCAEKMIRGAFVELYRGLGLLKTYSSLNMVAFTKILKKFDKVSNQQASASYLKAVKRSHFISSDKFSIALLICPLDIFYRPTRYCFIRVIRNIVCSPLYKVLMVDFFMADQLTSQIPLLRHMESTACYFLAGSFRTHQYETCKTGRLFKELAYVISFLAYYWRAMQCARRWFDESDVNHLANMGKYVSAMVAAGARITYANQQNHLWFSIVVVPSVVATVYQLYWDFVKDWGLFNQIPRTYG